ncbi:MAG: GldG family protein [Opitutaceae bacterium]|jgi:hypothetical protein
MSLSENLHAARWIRTANLILQAILILTLFAGINYLANNRAGAGDPWRIDLTRYHRFTLSPETIAYVRDLAIPVRIVVTEAEDDAPADLRGLLREYESVSESNPAGGRITVEYIDVDLARREAQQLGVEEPNSVFILRGGYRQVLRIDELYRFENQESSAFLGEQAITAAILDVASATKKRIYFLYGHSELRPDDPDPVRGLSTLREFLRQRDFDVDEPLLDLSATRRIPSDASLLVSVQPQTRFSDAEQELLRQYLAAGDGRLMLFLAPGNEHGLDRLLHDWGVTVDDDILRDSGAENRTEDGDFIVTSFAPTHPVTQALLHSSYKARLRLGPARTVRPDTTRAAGGGLDVVTLAASSPTAWGEVDFTARGSAAMDPRVDIRPLPSMDPPNRLGLVVAAEHVAARDNLPFSVRSGRLIVFGSGDLVDNHRFTDEGVPSLVLGAVNWMADRDTQLNIPPRPIERFQLLLSPRELQNLRYCLMFILPGAAALLGLIVYWTRRS